MKISKKSVVILAIVALAVTFGLVTKSCHHKSPAGQDTYYCPMHPTYTSNKPGDCPICNMKLVKREKEDKSMPMAAPNKTTKAEDICLMHNCPKMHDGKPCPMMVMGKAGEKIDCPVCGMHITANDKEAVKLVTPGGYASVLITPEKQQLIGIKKEAVSKRKLEKTIRTVGTVAHDPELYQAQSEYIQAIQALSRANGGSIPEIIDQSQRLVESSRIRLKHMGLSDDLIAEIATWKEPEHGLLFAHPGDPVWIYAKIYEYELPLIHLGQEITMDIPALPGKIFTGKIRAIDPMVEPATRTTRIRAQVIDEGGQLKPDMYVNVNIAIDLGETLAIPQEAVFDTGAQKIVFVDKGQGLFEPREVTVGAKADNYYELKSGLVENEPVITNGNFLIDSESRLKAALEGMGGSGGGHQHGQ